MGKRKVVNKIEAYSGMYINHNRNTYQLVQTDTSQKYCKGCALYNNSCPDRIVQLRRQGYIYLERQSYNERRILDRLDNWWWYSTCNISGYTKL